MLLVIFGAGASYDSADSANLTHGDEEARPPLAAQLFDPRPTFNKIATRFPASRPLVDRLRVVMGAAPATQLEEELGRLQGEAEQYIELQRQLVALRFYLRDVIETTAGRWLERCYGFTYYLRLMGLLGEWRNRTGASIVLATFNYDTLLDVAARDQVVGWSPSTMEAFTEREDWKLLKLHGSTNWARVITHPGGHSNADTNAREVIRMAERLDLAGPIEMLPDWHATLDYRPGLRAPAIAVPTSRKTTFECPPEQIRAFEDAIPRAEGVLMIGWRGAEEHALEKLQALAPGYALGIVTKGNFEPGGMQEIRRNLGTVFDKGKLSLAEDAGFGTFLADGGRRLGEWLNGLG